MEPKSLSDKQLTLMLNRCGEPMRSEIRSHISAMEAEHRALVADNAALTKHLRDANDPHRLGACEVAWCVCGYSEILSQPHPGAALLSEMDALRKRDADWAAGSEALQAECNRLKTERDEARAALAAKTAVALQYETDLQRAESTARAAALEAAEAIALKVASNHRSAQGRMETDIMRTAHAYASGAADDVACLIRALATTPPPPVVPVAKVLSRMYAARNHGDSGYNTGWSDAIRGAARDLGINLDGES